MRDCTVPENSAINFEINAGNTKAGEKFNVELYSTLKMSKDKKEVLRLKSKFVGFFSVVKGEENMELYLKRLKSHNLRM